jgi:hypothetical protein
MKTMIYTFTLLTLPMSLIHAEMPANNTQPTPITSPMPQPVVNCDYKIPNSTNQVDTQLVQTWTEKAIEQAFSFESAQLEPQIEKLKACFTPQGWQSFYDALKKSGNLTAIQQQNLSVSAMVNGHSTIQPTKSNEWQVNIPLQVVYQNQQQKLTQILDVSIIVGRKDSGDLGMTQVIATPKQPTTSSEPSGTAQPQTVQPPAPQPFATPTPSAQPTQQPPTNPTMPQSQPR